MRTISGNRWMPLTECRPKALPSAAMSEARAAAAIVPAHPARLYSETERDFGRGKRSGSEAPRTKSLSVCLLQDEEQCEMRGCGDAKGAESRRCRVARRLRQTISGLEFRLWTGEGERKGRSLIPQVPFLVRTSRINASIISESTRKLVWRSFMTDSSKSSRPRRSAELRMLRVPRVVRPLVLAASRPCFSSIRIAGILSSRAKEIASVSPLPRPISRSIWEGA